MTHSTNSSIKKNVMRRVYIVYALRPIVSAGALAVLVLAGALWGIGREVWVAHVLNNMPQFTHFYALSQFWVYAFLHTHMIVQVLVLMSIFAIVYLARTMARLIPVLLLPVHV